MQLKASGSLDVTFAALSDPTRRAILGRLAQRESSVMKLAEPFRISLPAISKHIRILENAGLLVRRKEGRVRRCTLVAAPMKEASDWIEKYRVFWERQFDALAEYLHRSIQEEKWKRKKRRRSSRSVASSPAREKGSLKRGQAHRKS